MVIDRREREFVLDEEKAAEKLTNLHFSITGGESCDELEEYTSLNQKEGVETGNGHYLPIRKRAKYRWLANRSSVASRWTWLTAQISDLEYRIRQQVI